MKGGTSPSIFAVGSGSQYEVAFQANTGILWTVGADNHDSWNVAIAAATSPGQSSAVAPPLDIMHGPARVAFPPHSPAALRQSLKFPALRTRGANIRQAPKRSLLLPSRLLYR